MSGGKSTEGFPVVDFTLSSRRPIDRSSEVPCGGFTFQPQIDSVAADMECLTRFALSHAIEFDRLNDFFTEVIAIRIGHRRHPHKLSLHLYRHVLVVLATAITFETDKSSRCINLILTKRTVCQKLYLHPRDLFTG